MAAGQPAGGKVAMPIVTMYSTGVCPYCQMAERLFKLKGVGGFDDLSALDRAGGLDKLLAA